MQEFFLYSMLIGAVAGFVAGLFGLGGGVLIVPALVWLYSSYQFPAELIMIMAVATSLASIVFTSLAAIYTHQCLRAINWSLVFRLTPGILLGAGVGAYTADYLAAEDLKWLFIVYLIFVGLRMAFPAKNNKRNINVKKGLDYWMGNVIGFVSSVLGIGGGTLTVPYLLARQQQMKNAVAVSSVCGFPIAVSGALSYILLGWQAEGLPGLSLGYIYLPALFGVILCSMLTAPVGAKLANKLPAKKLKQFFSLVILLIAFKMTLRHF